MSDFQQQQGQPYTPPQSTPPAAGKWYQRKRILLPLVAAIAFFFGIGAGSAGTEPTAETGSTENSEEVAADNGASDDLAAQVADLKAERKKLVAERDQLKAELEEQAREVARLEKQVKRARAEQPVEEEPQEEEPPAGGGSGTVTAGNYEFSDLQVGEDFSNAFEMRARVTNNGDDVEGVAWTATLFSNGSVVGTLQSTATDFGAGETITAEFFSLDAFEDYDKVEIQVDTEF